jgi:hypothetical protein
MADLGVTSDQLFRRMKLRYAGSCRSCVSHLPAGTLAVYDRERQERLLPELLRLVPPGG